jgi:hypothetical protein
MSPNGSGVVVAYVVGIAALTLGAGAPARSGPVPPGKGDTGVAEGQFLVPGRPRSPAGEDSLRPATGPGSGVGQPEAESGRWGSLRGRVIFNGQPPEPPIIADPRWESPTRDHRGNLIADAPPRRLPDHEVIARRGGPVRSEHLLVDAETRGVRNALVYLNGPSAIHDAARRAAPTTLRFRADRGVFVPHVLAAMQGAEILVSTDDLAVYQVRAQLARAGFLVEENDSLVELPRILSLDGGMNVLFGEFRDGRRVSLSVRPRAGHPRPMPIKEDIHPWMSAWWLILDHPYFAVTDERGTFEIRDVPTGPQRVVVWQESVGPRGKLFEGEVIIRDDGETVGDYVIGPAQVRAASDAGSRR